MSNTEQIESKVTNAHLDLKEAMSELHATDNAKFEEWKDRLASQGVGISVGGKAEEKPMFLPLSELEVLGMCKKFKDLSRGKHEAIRIGNIFIVFRPKSFHCFDNIPEMDKWIKEVDKFQVDMNEGEDGPANDDEED